MNRADSRRCSPRCLAEGHSLRLLSQFRCHKGGSRRLRRWKQPSSTSKEGSRAAPAPMRALPAGSSRQGQPRSAPRHGKPLQGRPARAGMTPWSPSRLQGKGRRASLGGQPEPAAQRLVPAPGTGRMPVTDHTPVPREAENSTLRSHLDLVLLIQILHPSL